MEKRSRISFTQFSVCTVLLVLLLSAMIAGCVETKTRSTPEAPAASLPADTADGVRVQYSPGEIPRLTAEAEERANASLAAIAAIPQDQRTPANTLVALDSVVTDYNDAVQPMILMGMVSSDPAVAAEGMAAQQSSSLFLAGVWSRRDLYDAVRDVQPGTSDEARLYNVTMTTFRHNGLLLPDDRLLRVQEMSANLTRLQVRFMANLNNDTTMLAFTREELEGVPDDALAGFDRTADGRYRVTLQGPDYPLVMRNANLSDTRRRLYLAHNNVQAEENLQLLGEAVNLRSEIARELGYATWADYRLDGRMAETPATAISFLEGMKGPLQEKNRAEMTSLLAIKKASDPAAGTVDPWDIAWLQGRQNKNLYDYSEDEVKEYFPADTVLSGMLRTYGTLLGIRFDEVDHPGAWSPDVRLFRVGNTGDNATIGYLYFDLCSRAGKSSSVFEREIRAGRMRNGTWRLPVAVIVLDLPEPAAGKPSLLTTTDAWVLFHETGHAMHGLLSRAPYGTLAGTNVQWDFCETPSQAMEEWFYDPGVMESVSGHYTDSSRKIPADLRDRVIASRNAGSGSYYSRQLVFALYDLRLHTSAMPVNATELFSATYEDVMASPHSADMHEPATFTHIMDPYDSYDAGYYGYLWSKVYALEIAGEFRRDGMTNQTTGMRYRQEILSRGNMADGGVLMENFLHRTPGPEAFYRSIGITVTNTSG